METQTATVIPANQPSLAVTGGLTQEIIIPQNRHELMKDEWSIGTRVKNYTTSLDEYENSVDYNKEYFQVIDQIRILHEFSSKIINNLKDLDPIIAKEVNDRLWDII